MLARFFSVNSTKAIGANFFSPLDWGIFLTSRNLPILARIAVIPALLGISTEYVRYYFPLKPEQMFLILVIELLVNTWLLVVTMLIAASSLQGKTSLPLTEIGMKALRSMPKVVFSYSMLVMFIFFSISLAPMLIFVLFLVWGPLFSAAEICIDQTPPKKIPQEEDEDFIFRKAPISTGVFRFKPIWDLGFGRSINFTTKNFSLTIQTILILWVATITPLALILSLAGYHLEFPAVVAQVLIASFLSVFIQMVICSSFLFALTSEASEELLILKTKQDLLEGKSGVRPGLRIQSRIVPLLLIFFLGVFSAYNMWDWWQRKSVKPESVDVSLSKIEITKEQFIVTLQLEDVQHGYRWLDISAFRLVLDPPPVEESKKVPEAVVESTKEVKKPTLISEPELPGMKPDRVMPFSTDGSSLSEDGFIPYEGRLQLKIYFSYPEKAQAAEGRYTLYYGVVPYGGELWMHGKFARDR